MVTNSPERRTPQKRRGSPLKWIQCLSISAILLSLFSSGCSSALPGSGASATSSVAGPLVASPSAVSFGGATPIGKSMSSTVTLTNRSATTLSIQSVQMSSPAFSLQGWTGPVTLLPGHSTQVALLFTPPSQGSYSGKLSIASEVKLPITVPPTISSEWGSDDGYRNPFRSGRGHSRHSANQHHARQYSAEVWPIRTIRRLSDRDDESRCDLERDVGCNFLWGTLYRTSGEKCDCGHDYCHQCLLAFYSFHCVGDHSADFGHRATRADPTVRARTTNHTSTDAYACSDARTWAHASCWSEHGLDYRGSTAGYEGILSGHNLDNAIAG